MCLCIILAHFRSYEIIGDTQFLLCNQLYSSLSNTAYFLNHRCMQYYIFSGQLHPIDKILCGVRKSRRQHRSGKSPFLLEVMFLY
jgi:hypothetical protein